ncbi:MAG TPA: TonB-dependent receptor [Telluria sp.]|jgi:iron complex outermembrane receptor protein
MKTTTPRGRRVVSPIHLAVLSLLAGIHAAHAQSTEPTVPGGSGAPPSQTAPTTQENDSGKIAEVIVTATKRSTSLQKTPIAITALNAQTLEDNHVQTLLDVVNLVPGFQATSEGDHGVTTMTLRGIGNDSAKTEYADPEVASFVDGIYSPRPEGATSLLFDLDAIEVLRGPQGTLWGRNSTVGAVNMQTAKPVLHSQSASLQGGMGDYNRYGMRGAFNIPLGDTAALRIAFVHEQHDGYVDYQSLPAISLDSQRAAWAASGGDPAKFQAINPSLFIKNGQKYDAQDQTAVRLSYLWQPTSNLRWNISYEHFADRGTPDMNLMQDPRAGQSFWSALIDTAPSLKRDTNSVRSRVEYQINPDMQLNYIAGWSKFDGSSTFDADGGAQVPTSFATGATQQSNNTDASHYTNYSHELELQSLGQREVDWQLGLYYGAEDNSMRFDIPAINGTQAGTISWQGSYLQPKETVQSEAAFGQATWNLSDSLHLTGGARYTHDKRTNQGGIGYSWKDNGIQSEVPVSGMIDPTNPIYGFTPNLPTNSGEYTGSKWTGLARLGYDIDRYNMVYASISTGYKSGGLQDGGKTYGAETLTNYELGTKSTFLGGSLVVDNALFYESFRDFQFSAPVTNPDGSHTLATNNADGAKVYGLESEITAKLTRDDRVMTALSWTPHAKLGYLIGGSNDYQLPVCTIPGITNCLNVTGHTLPHTPKFTAQVQYQHVIRFGDGETLAPRISAHYETASTLSVFDLGSPDEQKAYARADLGMRYTHDKWWLDLFVRNVSDNKIKTSASDAQGVWLAQYLPPRTYGFNAGVDF